MCWGDPAIRSGTGGGGASRGRRLPDWGVRWDEWVVLLRSDLLFLYEMLRGRTPFKGEALDDIQVYKNIVT